MASESYKFSEVEMSKSRIVKDRRSINKLLIYFSKMREEGGARVKGRLEKLQNESDLEARGFLKKSGFRKTAQTVSGKCI